VLHELDFCAEGIEISCTTKPYETPVVEPRPVFDLPEDAAAC
jgi:hypothetical protein